MKGPDGKELDPVTIDADDIRDSLTRGDGTVKEALDLTAKILWNIDSKIDGRRSWVTHGLNIDPQFCMLKSKREDVSHLQSDLECEYGIFAPIYRPEYTKNGEQDKSSVPASEDGEAEAIAEPEEQTKWPGLDSAQAAKLEKVLDHFGIRENEGRYMIPDKPVGNALRVYFALDLLGGKHTNEDILNKFITSDGKSDKKHEASTKLNAFKKTERGDADRIWIRNAMK